MKNTIIRILACLLALLTLTLCAVACGGGKTSKGGALYFKANDIKITIGADAEDTIDKLGKWVSQNSSDSCGGFSGKDYIYAYKGYSVSTTPSKNGQIVCKIELTDDSVKTPQGLYIGMSRKDAEKAMEGFTAESVGDNLVYTQGDVKLQVIFRDGSVAGIVYVAK
jgi:hypothetical protein